MNRNEEEQRPSGSRGRLDKTWFWPVGIVGAFTGLVAMAFRSSPDAKPAPHASGAISGGPESRSSTPTPRKFDRVYELTAVLGGNSSADPFRRSLVGIDAGTGAGMVALGDNEVRVYDAGGKVLRRWQAVAKAECIAAGPDGRVYVGANDLVTIYNDEGSRVGGFAAGDAKAPARITAIKPYGKEILLADADARIIRRYDPSGRQLGLIGTESKTRSFMLPNKSLDFDIDAKGVVRATDTGRHQVTAWSIGGSPLGKFGKFGMANPEDFVGCCNPVNLAIAPDGSVITAEKMISRVKVFTPDGKLLALIGPENFDPNCIHIHLAVDSRGRILAADPVRREIKIFALAAGKGNEPPGGLDSPAHGKPSEVARG
jgi:sugar lactone lactonase YvrE